MSGPRVLADLIGSLLIGGGVAVLASDIVTSAHAVRGLDLPNVIVAFAVGWIGAYLIEPVWAKQAPSDLGDAVKKLGGLVGGRRPYDAPAYGDAGLPPRSIVTSNDVGIM